MIKSGWEKSIGRAGSGRSRGWLTWHREVNAQLVLGHMVEHMPLSWTGLMETGHAQRVRQLDSSGCSYATLFPSLQPPDWCRMIFYVMMN